MMDTKHDTQGLTVLSQQELAKVLGGADGGDNLLYKMYRYLEGTSTGGNGYGR